YDEGVPGLQRASAERMTGQPVLIDRPQADVLLAQFRETADYRDWHALAVAIMVNHVHLVVRVPDDPNPTKVLGDFKAYGSRALNVRFGRRVSGTWWTYDGSKRKLPDKNAVAAAVYYVLYKQYQPLLTWSPELGII